MHRLSVSFCLLSVCRYFRVKPERAFLRFVSSGLCFMAALYFSLSISAVPEVRVSYFETQLECDTLPDDLRLSYYDSLINRNPRNVSGLMLKKAQILDRMGNIREALDTYGQLEVRLESLPARSQLDVIYYTAHLYHRIVDEENALKTMGRLLCRPLPDSLSYYHVRGYVLLSNIYYYLEDYQKMADAIVSARQLMESKKSHFSPVIASKLESSVCIEEATAAKWQKRYEEAFQLLNRAKELDPSAEDVVNIDIGSLLSVQGEHDLAAGYYAKALESGNPDAEIKAIAASNLAFTAISQGDYSEAIGIMDRHAGELAFWKGSIQEASLCEARSEALEKLGDYAAALRFQRRGDSIRNEIMSPDRIRALERQSVEIAMSEMENKNQAQSRRLTILGWLLIFASSSALVASVGWVVTIGSLRSSRKDCRRLRLRMDEEDRKHRMSEKEASESLELRNQEISSIAIQLANVRENIENLKKIAANPKIKKTEIVEAVEATVRQISLEEKVIDPVVTSFEKVNQSLFDRLYKLHPNLTNAEIRMCGYILMNRTNKEIATMIHRSVRTVETIKYTLRKKLGITEPTESYLRQLSLGEDFSDK